jgi:hypothetical protein
VYRALLPVTAAWIGIGLYGLTTGDAWLALASALMSGLFAAAYSVGLARDPQHR